MITLGMPRTVSAVSVEARLSNGEEAMLGEAVEFLVIIEGASSASVPTMPPMPDFTVRLLTPQPQRKSFTQIDNGRFESRSTLIWGYELRPRKIGRLTIPPVTVDVGGQKYRTEPVTLNVIRSDTKSLLIVEIVSQRESVFVEQPFDLTLRVWVRPYRQSNILLTAEQMYGLFKGQSELGPFAKQVATNNLSARTMTRKDDQGQEYQYYVYECSLNIWPDKPGPYQLEPVTITLAYPVRLRQDFFNELRVAQSRTLVEQAKAPHIIVKPIPQEGRPVSYNGAVGRFEQKDWKVWPDRTDVNRGQLITLNMEIAGKSRLDRVPAPPLAKLPELAKSFKVLDEQLAGEIKENKKVFRQQIRAIDEKTREIPPIPFSFFDPEADGGKGKFTTLLSPPMPITVHAAATLTPSEIQAPSAAGAVKSSLLTEAADSIRANYADPEQVLADQVFSPGMGWTIAMILPPVAWLTTWGLRRHRQRLQSDVAFARRRRAKADAVARLRSTPGPEGPAAQVHEALLGYVADRANLPTGGLTRADAIEHLRKAGLPSEQVHELDSLLDACEAARYAGLSGDDRQMVDRAERCIGQLERTWKR